MDRNIEEWLLQILRPLYSYYDLVKENINNEAWYQSVISPLFLRKFKLLNTSCIYQKRGWLLSSVVTGQIIGSFLAVK